MLSRKAGLVALKSLLLVISPVAFCDSDVADFTEYDASMDMVLTPTRSRISIVDSPLPVTRIPSEKLFQLGITSLDDAMRLVPGFLIGYENGNIPEASYHGASPNSPKRMEVVMDKLPIYRPSHARVDWFRFPIRTSDLNSVEVARGAGVVDYGSNSFLATVNLLSRTALDKRASVSATADTKDNELYEGVLSWADESLSMSLRINTIHANGFDEDSQGSDLTDSSEMRSAFYKLNYSVSPSSSITFKAIASETDYEYPIFPEFTLDREFDAAQDDNFALVTYENSFSDAEYSNTLTASLYVSDFKQRQEFYRYYPKGTFNEEARAADRSPTISMPEIAYNLVTYGRLPTIDPSRQSPEDVRLLTNLVQAVIADPSLISLIPGHDNQDLDENLIGAEFEYLLQVGPFKNIINVMARNIQMESETYLGGTAKADIWSVSDNFGWAATERVYVNFGIAGEKNNFVDNVAMSYRGSFNFKPEPWQSFRFNYSVSKRLPDIYDTSMHWISRVTFEDGYTDAYGNSVADMFHLAESPEDVKPERLESIDLGWYANFYEADLTFDIKVFKENFSSLISEPMHYLWFDQLNDGWLRQTGAEIGAGWLPGRYEFGASYMYLDANAPELTQGIAPDVTGYVAEKTLYARHSGSIYGLYKFDTSTLSLAYYGNSVLGNGAAYDRFDFTATKTLHVVNSVESTLSFNARYYPKT